ncbi:hypothetical protein QUB61_22715 [Microcoleus sp. C2D2]
MTLSFRCNRKRYQWWRNLNPGLTACSLFEMISYINVNKGSDRSSRQRSLPLLTLVLSVN